MSLTWKWLGAQLSVADADMDLSEHSVTAGFSVDVGAGWTIAAAAGAVLAGRFNGAYGDFDVEPGWLVGVAANWAAVDADGGIPFVDLAVAVSAAGRPVRDRVTEQSDTLYAVDMRLGVTVGWAVGQRWRPYVAARVFGGPVMWARADETLSGTDRGHVQLAVGSTFDLGKGISLYGEYSPWFEQGAHTGLAVAF